MPQHIGVIERSVGDDWPAAVDLSAIDVFTTNEVSSATVAASAVTGTAPTLGTVSPSDNVCTFRVSGGTAGESQVTITATNAADPANVIVRVFTVVTR